MSAAQIEIRQYEIRQIPMTWNDTSIETIDGYTCEFVVFNSSWAEVDRFDVPVSGDPTDKTFVMSLSKDDTAGLPIGRYNAFFVVNTGTEQRSVPVVLVVREGADLS